MALCSYRNTHIQMYSKTGKCIDADLHNKSHCVEVGHQPALEESKNIVNGSVLEILVQNIKPNTNQVHPWKLRKCVPVGELWNVHGSRASACSPSLEA